MFFKVGKLQLLSFKSSWFNIFPLSSWQWGWSPIIGQTNFCRHLGKPVSRTKMTIRMNLPVMMYSCTFTTYISWRMLPDPLVKITENYIKLHLAVVIYLITEPKVWLSKLARNIPASPIVFFASYIRIVGMCVAKKNRNSSFLIPDIPSWAHPRF